MKTSELKAKPKEAAKSLTPKGKEKVAGGGEKVGEKQETETAAGQQQGVSPKLFAPFFEVRQTRTHSSFNFFAGSIWGHVVFVVILFKGSVYSHTLMDNQIYIRGES